MEESERGREEIKRSN